MLPLWTTGPSASPKLVVDAQEPVSLAQLSIFEQKIRPTYILSSVYQLPLDSIKVPPRVDPLATEVDPSMAADEMTATAGAIGTEDRLDVTTVALRRTVDRWPLPCDLTAGTTTVEVGTRIEEMSDLDTTTETAETTVDESHSTAATGGIATTIDATRLVKIRSARRQRQQ